ncbi:hypothetical protein [Aporhodopirellula aestuarii]|uniref:Uncharacterized protein n=1 Tax=Aporhodopirellula aestuarii TaxID=2950107 RepID=A0ABT0U3S3_9BACT|nr:hypothetical protein [Aporhodopirellula aestuarii]MCM2371532.1 hypothetical protein [Aporhodopirellula aestuarii]
MTDHPEDTNDLTERLRSFHQSLRAAVIAGTKLDLGTPRATSATTTTHPGSPVARTPLGGIATLAKIDQLEPLLAELIQSEQTQTGKAATPEEQDVPHTLPTSYVSAFRVFQQTRRIDLILDSLTLTRTIADDLAGAVRPVWFYLAMMLVVATAGVAIFANFSSPKIAAIRADLELTPAGETSESWIAEPNLKGLLVALPLLAAGMILLGVTTKGSAAIVTGLGGRRYRTDRSRAVLAEIERARCGDDSTSDPSARRNRLSLISRNAGSLAQHRLTRLKIGLPSLLIAVLGGGGALLYCLTLFGPLIWLIHDLATIATEHGVWP